MTENSDVGLHKFHYIHFCACHKQWPGFPMSYVMVFFVFNGMSSDERWLFVLLILLNWWSSLWKPSFH